MRPSSTTSSTIGDEAKISKHHVLVMIALILAEISASFEITMIYSAMRALIVQFGGPVAVGWLITVFLLTAGVAAAIIGRLGDLYGRRKVMIVVLAIAGSGSFLSAMSSHLWLVILGRAIQGASGAILPLAFGLVRENLPARHVPLGIGLAAGASAIAGGAGLMLGGVLADSYPWHSIFIASAMSAVAAIIATALFVPKSQADPRAAERLDIVGGLLFAPAVLGLLLAASVAPAWGGWTSPSVGGLVLASIMLLYAWVRHELRHPNPLFDVRLLADRRIAFANLALGIFACCGMQMALIQAAVLQQPPESGAGFGLSATFAGILQVPPNFIALVTGPLGGYISGRFGGRLGMMIGLALLVGGSFIMLLSLSTLGAFACGIVLGGAGITLFVASQPNVVLSAVSAERTSEAAGVSTVVRSVFHAIGTQVVVMLLASGQVHIAGAAWPTLGAIRMTYVFMIGFGVTAFLLTLAIPRQGRRSASAMH